jgi:hypothetical protein
LLLVFLLGFFVLIGLQPKQSPFATTLPMVEVRRALPVVLRALPVTASVADPVGQWHSVRFTDGSSMQIYNRGWLAYPALLPARGGFVGDAYIIIAEKIANLPKGVRADRSRMRGIYTVEQATAMTGNLFYIVSVMY